MTEIKNQMSILEKIEELKKILKENEQEFDKIQLDNDEEFSKISGIATDPTEKMVEMHSILGQLKNEISEINRKIEDLPIKKAIVGEWKIVDHENLEEYRRKTGNPIEKLTKNIRFEIRNNSLILFKKNFLCSDEFCEENIHLKTSWSKDNTTDRFIVDGRLHVVTHLNGAVFKRIYEKI